MKKMIAKTKQKILAGIALVVVVILVMSGIYVYNLNGDWEEDVEEVVEQII